MVGAEVYFTDGSIVDSRIDPEPHRTIREVLERLLLIANSKANN